MKQLEIAHLDKAFDQQVLFKDANYTFKQGKIYGLLGRNGSGKSTLFNMIVRNLPHDHGTIAIDADDGQGLITDYADTSVGMVYTQPHLPAFMTGVEFVDYFMAINRQRLEQTHTSVKAADFFSLAHEMQQMIVAMKVDSVVVFSTHIMQLAQAICDAVVLLHDKKLSELEGLDIHSQEFEEAVIARLSDEVQADA